MSIREFNTFVEEFNYVSAFVCLVVIGDTHLKGISFETTDIGLYTKVGYERLAKISRKHSLTI